MGLLSIDVRKCKKDGICIEDCPFGIIKFREDNGYPDTVPGSETVCAVCGHCVAVCPYGALSHEGVPIQLSPAIKKKLVITEGQAVQFLRSRRSVRLYEDKPVEREKIEKLIGVARYAPTAANAQLVEWLVLSDRAEIHELAAGTIDWLRRRLKDDSRLASIYPRFLVLVKLWDNGYDSVLRNAPTVILASAPKEDVNGMVDVTLALSYLDLLAPALGLGTCWAGLLQGALLSSPSLRERAGIPEGHSHHYPMMLGYPKIRRYYRLPERKAPKITFR